MAFLSKTAKEATLWKPLLDEANRMVDEKMIGVRVLKNCLDFITRYEDWSQGDYNYQLLNYLDNIIDEAMVKRLSLCKNGAVLLIKFLGELRNRCNSDGRDAFDDIFGDVIEWIKKQL